MLSLSAADEKELETWRTKNGRCQLPSQRRRLTPDVDTALERLPTPMAENLRRKWLATGQKRPLALTGEEVASLAASERLEPRHLMVMLLDLASALAMAEHPTDAIGAVAQGASGALYIGAPYFWRSPQARFSLHGVQVAILNALAYGEREITRIAVETTPCACCRQFLREMHNWRSLKLLVAKGGPLSLQEDDLSEIALPLEGLRGDGLKGRLFDEKPRVLKMSQMPAGPLGRFAAQAAAASYAPYSHNSAGVALITAQGFMHHGGYIEAREGVASVLAVEAALMDLLLSGGSIGDIKEMLLIEARGEITQFSATQKLVSALGPITFSFVMAS